MSTELDSLKRKLLIKYPTFGSTIANLTFQSTSDIDTACTDGNVVRYNSKFIEGLSEKQQVFVLAHEVCHVAFQHINRSKGKNKKIWNIATDAVINALLKQDGLEAVDDIIDMPEAVNYDAEEMYSRLLKQAKEQDNDDSKDKNEKTKKCSHVGHDSHEMWDKTIEQNHTPSKFVEQGERESFKRNKEEKSKRLHDLSKELAKKSSSIAGIESVREKRRICDIGNASPLIDWRKLLRQAIKFDEEYTRKNVRMRNGLFRHKIEQIPIPETEILLDVSGSVSEILLKNFLRECKNIVKNSKVKVGCFNTVFHGFTDLKKAEDIEKMTFPIGGGTDFDSAVEAFSQKVPNKIIFTDGEAEMPVKMVKNVIWVVFGYRNINPKGGKVINITGDQLDRLYQPFVNMKEDFCR